MYTIDSGAILLSHRINRNYSQCFTESVSLRDIGKSTWRAQISSPSSLYFKAVKGAHIGSALHGDKKLNVFQVAQQSNPFDLESVLRDQLHHVISNCETLKDKRSKLRPRLLKHTSANNRSKAGTGKSKVVQSKQQEQVDEMTKLHSLGEFRTKRS